MALDSLSDLSKNCQDQLQRAHKAAQILSHYSGSERSLALKVMAKSLQEAQDEILEANTLDLEACQDMAVPNLIKEWLKLTPERLEASADMLRHLAHMADPLQRVMANTYGEEQTQAYVQPMPLGVIALVYESLPELAAIAAGLCIRTGNSLILRGGVEASYSSAAIVSVLQNALEQTDLPPDCLSNLGGDDGTALKDLLTQDRWINLVIPYGRPSLVQRVIQQATTPVLKTGMGNCYLYWAASGKLDTVRWVISDSHASEPDPVNAIEKVLIHREVNEMMLRSLWNYLKEQRFSIRLDSELAERYPDCGFPVETEWCQPYLEKTIAFHVVNDLQEAIAWINSCSSGHADVLVTESYAETRTFSQQLNSAICYINTSPRFYRNAHEGATVALGMSNQKGHRRGRISLDALTTVKKVVLGNGVDH
ncbi:MAG: glutamate-5-semialdehyde dehydrogenase [Prochlorotrichaceae cyanobacterium]|jgi:glutamate-5-semialdehyde dehydrogenase